LNRPGERRARIAAADATVLAGEAEARTALLNAEAEVARAFFQTLAAGQRERLAMDAESGARRAVEALQRRHELRDVALLDVNVGRGALARATAQLRAARADRLAAEGRLRALLSLDAAEPLRLSGDLRDQRRFALQALLDRVGERADVRSTRAGAQLAEAQAALDRSARWPRLSLGVAYEREEGADIGLLLLGVELPVFDRGQPGRASAEARARRLYLESESRSSAASATVRGAHASFQERVGAARVLEQALPLLTQNEELARKSYEAGQLSLTEWLLVRREGLEARLEHVEQLLAAAEAGVELALAAGVSP
jgi:cobalt-zinc-cadmium efflux system outer membrane protein